MPVFDFSGASASKAEAKCTYTTFHSSHTKPSPEQPIMVLDNKERQWKHHSCGVFTNPVNRTAFDFKEEDGNHTADVLKIDSRFTSLLKWLGDSRINVRLSGTNREDGYAVYRIRETAFGGGTKLSAEDGFLQFMIERLLASSAPAEIIEDEDEEETYRIVTTVREDALHGLISIDSPVGKALLGHRVGDTVHVQVNDKYGYDVEIRKIDKSHLSAFDLQGYQVVRNQFTQVRYEGPSLTISEEKITFNLFCMKKFDDVGFVQLLLHPTERKIAIRPCQETDVHSIRWRPDPTKQFYSKTLLCQHFGNALYNIMKWNPDFLYKIRGIWAKRLNEQIIVFNLTNAMPAVFVTKDGTENAVKQRVELCPDEWTDDFGEEFYEHTLENGFYYLTPDSDWQTKTQSIPAPGIEQYLIPSAEELQQSMATIKKGTDDKNE